MIEELQRLGIAQVRITYNGANDEGYIEDYYATSATDEAVDILRTDLISSLRDWAYDVLEQHFGGWEINEGSDGEIILNVADASAEVTHNENVVTQTTSKVAVQGIGV